MKKRHFTIIVLILLVALSGCGIRGRGTDATNVPTDVYKGTKGLEMNFVKNMPQAKLFDTSELTILLELENKGNYDLSGSKCRLHLSGFDNKIIKGLVKEKECSSSLEGKTGLNPTGSYDTQQFSTNLIEIPEYLDSLPQTIMATACYEYQTKAAPIVCIDPQLYELGPIERACNVRDISVSGGQGAPVAVINVDTEIAGKTRASFNIRVSNVGGGTVLDRGASVFNECPFSVNPKDYNIVSYDVDMSGGRKVKCSPEIDGNQKLRLVNEKGTIFCTFEISGETAYTTPLQVTLNYNYMDSISKNIEVIKTP